MILAFEPHGQTLRIECRVLFLELCRMYLSRRMALAEIGKSTGDIAASAFSRNTARLAEKIQKRSLLETAL